MSDTQDDDLIDKIASPENIGRIIHDLGEKDIHIFVPALRSIGNILTSNDAKVIERCLWEGCLDKLTNLLYSSNSSIIKETCWALSNITAGPPHHIKKFIESTALDRIINLIHSTNIDNRKEALWVICNAVTGADFDSRKEILLKNGS